jgi:hypothetical protein
MHDDGWVDDVEDKPDAWSDELPWRRRLPKWPDEWRERWGLRANELEESGLGWIEAEKQAWNETLEARKRPETVAMRVEPKRTNQSLFKESA